MMYTRPLLLVSIGIYLISLGAKADPQDISVIHDLFQGRISINTYTKVSESHINDIDSYLRKNLSPSIYDQFIIQAEHEVSNLINAELRSTLKDGKENIVTSRVFAFLKSTPYIKMVGLNAIQQLFVILHAARALKLPGGIVHEYMRNRSTGGVIFPPCNSIPQLSDQPMPFPSRFSCCPLPRIRCSYRSPYRTIDGSCNCPSNPDMGRSNRAFRRLLNPDYADGVSAPRADKNGHSLPSARLISTSVFDALPGQYSDVLTQLHFSTGQFVDHDLDRTSISKLRATDGTLRNVRCGFDGCQTSLPEDMECFPIPVPRNDPFFRTPCLMFVRSQAFFEDKCVISARQQANALTTWLDASQVYGSSKEDLDKLREFLKNPRKKRRKRSESKSKSSKSKSKSKSKGSSSSSSTSSSSSSDTSSPSQSQRRKDSDIIFLETSNGRKVSDIIFPEPSKDRGRLLTSRNPVHPECGPLLPTYDDKECRGTNDKIKCFIAGDERQNEQIGLTAMHTIFMRLHNVFESKLHYVNPHWDGERLFQETRKLVIGVWQNIIYSEYLPPLLGDDIMKAKSLHILNNYQCFKGFNCNLYNGDVPNVFATAALRHGHSQVGKFLRLSDQTYKYKRDVPLSSVMFNPTLIYQKQFSGATCGVESILFGLSNQYSDNVDRFFTQQITRHLFTDKPSSGVGMDLPAMNIQRGRDHGIPGYTKWRAHCGLSVPTSFYNMEDIPRNIRSKFASLYRYVDDIDLFAAAMTETPVKGGIVGPTFACIISDHFKNVKFADRFWFERCNTREGFTINQINSIREYTFGRIYCDTLQGVRKIQKFPMMASLRQTAANLRVSTYEVKRRYPIYQRSNNERVYCNQLKEIDFRLWRE